MRDLRCPHGDTPAACQFCYHGWKLVPLTTDSGTSGALKPQADPVLTELQAIRKLLERLVDAS